MADYKRLVSYMYNYEDGVKRNNVGYARVESRNGQCKYTLHISAPSLNERQLKVYIFKRSTNGIEGVLLGNINIRNGVGDFRVITDSVHIMNSPHGINDMGGMVLYHSNRKYFATEWDGKSVTISMVAQLEEQDAVKKEKEQENDVKAAGLTEMLTKPSEVIKESQSYIVPTKEAESKGNLSDLTFVKSKDEKNSFKEEDSLEKLINPSFNPVKSKKSDEINGDEQKVKDYKECEEGFISNDSPVTEETKEVPEEEVLPETEEVPETENVSEEEVPETEEVPEAKESSETEKASEEKSSQINSDSNKLVENSDQETKGNENQTTQNINTKIVFEDHPLAKQMYGSFPKMYPFEDNEIAWCVRIEPKDIGMLPMESWALGNNSFLLHGYYSYRHIIFARINDKNGMNYILGVPGIYHNREKFMAKMFGFENFKCAKRKQQRTGEFGYWYIPVILN